MNLLISCKVVELEVVIQMGQLNSTNSQKQTVASWSGFITLRR